MARRYSRKPPLQISAEPLAQQRGEPAGAYQQFLFFVEADGNRSFAEIALKFGKQPDTPRRYSAQWRWHDRLELIKNARNESPALVVPDGGDPALELQTAKVAGELDPVAFRIESALDVAERSYREASALHRQLYGVASQAAKNLTPEDIKSVAELRQVVQLTGELAKTKTELSTHINGIEELAKAVSKIRRRRG